MNNKIIIVGSAPCAEADIRGIPDDLGAYDFMGIGLDAADKWKIYKYVVTYEPVDFPEFKRRREMLIYNTDYITASQEEKAGWVNCLFPEFIAPNVPYSGSSTLLGVKVALRFGYRKIILCGSPLDDPKYVQFRPGWLFVQDMIRDTVRSMSGWTRTILGEPTEEWLNG